MAANVKKKTIDGVQFTVAPFRVMEALRVKALLARTAGPALGEAVGALGDIGGGLAGARIDGPALSGALEKLLSSLDEDRFLGLVERLFQNVSAVFTPEGGSRTQAHFGAGNFEVAMEAVFAGRIFSMYPAILLVLEANYPDFFERAARGFGGPIPAANGSATETPSGGDGSSASGT